MKLFILTYDNGIYDGHGNVDEHTTYITAESEDEANAKAEKMCQEKFLYNKSYNFAVEELKEIDGYNVLLVKRGAV